MLRECIADLRELAACRDCYRYSQEKPCEKYWFCKPCRPFHELVYAKQKGFPYWPAKVIQGENDEGLLEDAAAVVAGAEAASEKAAGEAAVAKLAATRTQAAAAVFTLLPPSLSPLL